MIFSFYFLITGDWQKGFASANKFNPALKKFAVHMRLKIPKQIKVQSKN